MKTRKNIINKLIYNVSFACFHYYVSKKNNVFARRVIFLFLATYIIIPTHPIENVWAMNLIIRYNII